MFQSTSSHNTQSHTTVPELPGEAPQVFDSVLMLCNKNFREGSKYNLDTTNVFPWILDNSILYQKFHVNFVINSFFMMVV